MYRQNRLYGCSLVTFGIGVLVGIWLKGGFWAHCFGLGLVFLGVRMCCRK